MSKLAHSNDKTMAWIEANCEPGPDPEDFMKSDKEILDFLDAWGNIEIGVDPDDDMRTVHRVTGPINDREWTEIGRGMSLRVALDRAMTATAEQEAKFNRSLLKPVE